MKELLPSSRISRLFLLLAMIITVFAVFSFSGSSIPHASFVQTNKVKNLIAIPEVPKNPFSKSDLTPGESLNGSDRFNGISLVSPPNQVSDSWAKSVQNINAGWVAILPFAFSRQGKPAVIYNVEGQWWGERPEGIAELASQAIQNDLQVMLKPQVWIPESWPGGYALDNEEDWKLWEKEYASFILDLALIADSLQIGLFCIGTELKISASERPKFWRDLIKQIRRIYKGKLTYAANWDNYKNVTFWDDLDYIGIDAYFPLSEDKTPLLADLVKSWRSIVRELRSFSENYKRPIIFTEYGYKSIDHTAWKQWELERIPYDKNINLKAQDIAYRAFFESIWHEPWFSGGFLWQWYTHHASAGGDKNSDYTPQNKPSEHIIRQYYAGKKSKQ